MFSGLPMLSFINEETPNDHLRNLDLKEGNVYTDFDTLLQLLQEILVV